MLFPVAPEVLHRVEFRRVSGQALQFEPGPLAGDPLLDQAAAVRGQTVPDDQQPAREIGQEMAGITWWRFYFRLFPEPIRGPQVIEFLTHAPYPLFRTL